MCGEPLAKLKVRNRTSESIRASAPVPILTYHSLDQSGSVISLTPQLFERQMRTLSKRGFKTLRLTDLLQGWNGKTSLPKHPVVLTFDDGFANFAEWAAPILGEFGFTATIYAVPGYAGKTNNWPSQPSEIPQLPLLGWSDLCELARQGFEIGCHTMTHAPSTQLKPEDLRKEIVESKHLLEDRLGQPVTTFAYPYGVSDSHSQRLVQQHYSGACGVKLDLARSDQNPYQLSRVDTYYLRTVGTFRMLGTPWGSAYLRLRQAGRALHRMQPVANQQQV